MTIDRELSTVARDLRATTVRVHDGDRGSGSGVVWHEDGLVVTNAHVVRSASAIVECEDGRRVRGELVRRDDARDLAVVRTAERFERAATHRPACDLVPGELVVAVGNPLGLVGALTAGVVRRSDARWIVSDVRLAPGSSGGALADAAGRVVGINSMVADGLGFAIPTETVTAFLRDERVASGRRLGVAVTPAVARFGLRRTRAYVVTAVASGGAAERSGLELGDAIVAADGDGLADSDVARALATAHTLTILRAGATRTVAIAA